MSAGDSATAAGAAGRRGQPPPPLRSRSKRALRWAVRTIAAFGALHVAFVGTAWLRVAMDDETVSDARGSRSRGSLVNGHPIAPWGPGFVTYSFLGAALGRQYIHGAVRAVLLPALDEAATAHPGTRFVVAETGWPTGGPFSPHHTHENGTSVDVLVPMRDRASGAPESLSSSPFALFGYGHELDRDGRLGALELDASALASFLCALDALGSEEARPTRIILAPELQPAVEDAMAPQCRARLRGRWLREAAWWRHDEHLHVDFDVP